MVLLPRKEQYIDPAMEQVDSALAAAEARKSAQLSDMRFHIGMSQIGFMCQRQVWYRFRMAAKEEHSAQTVRRFENGHVGESIMAKRLSDAKFTVITVDEKTGNQFGFVAKTAPTGHFCGSIDGVIKGIPQAPATWHVWEHKTTNERNFNKLKKLLDNNNEKNVLELWNSAYYAQAQLYMYHAKLKRHYMTVSLAGELESIGFRTNLDSDYAKEVVDKAQFLIDLDSPPKREYSGNGFPCGWCHFKQVCDSQRLPSINCRTCIHGVPADDGKWHCELKKQLLPRATEIKGCEDHRYMPSLVHPLAGAVHGDPERNEVIYCVSQLDGAGKNVLYFANGKRNDTTEFKDVCDDIKCYTSAEMLAASVKDGFTAWSDDELAQLKQYFDGEVIG